MAVVGDGDNSGFFERTNRRKFFARDIFRNRAGDKKIHRAFLRRAVVDERDGSDIINRRRSVRHADDGSESAARCCRRAAGDIFLGRQAGFAEMDVQVNQAGTDNFFGDIETFDFFGRFGGEIFSDGGIFSVENQNIRHGIELISGVNDAPAGEKQRIHAPRIAAAD